MSKDKKKGGCLKIGLIIVAIIVVLGVIGTMGKDSNDKSQNETQKVTEASTNKSAETNASIESATETIKENDEDGNIPTEYKSALKKAKSYSDMMHMSKAGIYNQLTSEYGEKFTAEAAQYAIDNVEADWSKQCIKKS